MFIYPQLTDKGKSLVFVKSPSTNDGARTGTLVENVEFINVKQFNSSAMDTEPMVPPLALVSLPVRKVNDVGSSTQGGKSSTDVVLAGTLFNVGTLPKCETPPAHSSSAHKSLMTLPNHEDAADILAELQHQPFLLD